MIAITRPVSASIADCELTHLTRQPIHVARAVAQHADYLALLAAAGCTLVRVRPAPELPDAVFVEDIAVVLDEVGIITRPGSLSRRGELAGVAAAVSDYRPVLFMTDPATLDGGDVLRLGRRLYVGRSARTTEAGIEQLRKLVRVLDYEVIGVEFRGCLHLKSAVTEVADGLLVFNPSWVSIAAFPEHEGVAVHGAEPYAANALRVGIRVIYPSQYPQTRERLAARGIALELLEYDELAKAEGGVTCCCLIMADA